jgi:predicted MFS family arabinose efflux permease
MSSQSQRLSQGLQDEQAVSAASGRGSALLIWWAACSFAAILGFSRLSYGLLLPALQADLKGSYGIYGLLGTLNFVGYLLGTVVLTLTLPSIRQRLTFNLITSCAMNVTLLLSSVSFALWQLGLWRFLNGFFASAATVLTLALTMECVPLKARGTVSGLIWAGGALGILVSGLIVPLALTLNSFPGWRVVWIGMGVIGIAAALGFYLSRRVIKLPAQTIKSQASERQTAGKTFAGLFVVLFQPRRLLFLNLAYICFGCGYIIYFTFFIALLEQQGVSVLSAGFVWAAIGAAGAVSGWIWGRVLDRWPTGFVLALALLLGAIGSLSVLLHSQGWDAVGAGLVGLCAFVAPALMVTALLKNAVSDEEYPTSLSLFTALFACGQIIGPLVSSWIVQSSGLAIGTASSAWVLALAALCAGAYGIVQRQTQR